MTAVNDGPLAIDSHGLGFKLYPNCASTHRCLDALQALATEHRFGMEDVERVETRVGRVNLVNLKYPEPRDPREAMFSMPYAVATMLRYGTVTLADFTPQAVRDDATRRLMPRVEMRLDSTRGETATELLPHTTVVTLKDGRHLQRVVHHAKGSFQNPFSALERQAKFEQCTRGILAEDRLAPLRDSLASPQGIKVRPLLALLQFEAQVDDGTRFGRRRGGR
jgi:2-methylcitrate dehydratase PrpD